MRSRAIPMGISLFVLALGLLAPGACSSPSPAAPAQPCVAAGGVCVITISEVSCWSFLSETCSAGYTCCTVVDAADLVSDSDAGADVGAVDAASFDATLDASVEGSAPDVMVRADAKTDGLVDAPAPRDARAADASDAHVEDAQTKDARADDAHMDDARSTDAVSDTAPRG